MFLADIAKRQGISEKYLEQIFATLRAAGLVSTVRGRKGGFLLGEAACRDYGEHRRHGPRRPVQGRGRLRVETRRLPQIRHMRHPRYLGPSGRQDRRGALRLHHRAPGRHAGGEVREGNFHVLHMSLIGQIGRISRIGQISRIVIQHSMKQGEETDGNEKT